MNKENGISSLMDKFGWPLLLIIVIGLFTFMQKSEITDAKQSTNYKTIKVEVDKNTSDIKKERNKSNTITMSVNTLQKDDKSMQKEIDNNSGSLKQAHNILNAILVSVNTLQTNVKHITKQIDILLDKKYAFLKRKENDEVL